MKKLGIFVGIVKSVLLILILFIAFISGAVISTIAIEEDCQDNGWIELGEIIYECNKVIRVTPLLKHKELEPS